jgi:hypothetical protein
MFFNHEKVRTFRFEEIHWAPKLLIKVYKKDVTCWDSVDVDYLDRWIRRLTKTVYSELYFDTIDKMA